MSETATKRRRKRPRGKFPTLLVWRLSLNLNQRDAALVLGLNQSKYSRLERRLYFPVRDEARQIMDRTGVPLEVLVGVA